mgnify:CR=1 FL=1
MLHDVPYVFSEEPEIPNITHRVVVLPCPVPDVELDVGETVIRVFAVAVLVLKLESVVLGDLALVVLSGGLRAVAELGEGEFERGTSLGSFLASAVSLFISNCQPTWRSFQKYGETPPGGFPPSHSPTSTISAMSIGILNRKIDSPTVSISHELQLSKSSLARKGRPSLG